MSTRIFVNLPTADLERSKEFYTALGAEINPLLTDDNAACVVWSDTVYFMMLTKKYFATFTDKTIADAKTTALVQVAMSRDSREDVDTVVEKGLAAGGSEPREAQDYGFMYTRDLDDPDGNSLSFLWMDPVAAEEVSEAAVSEQASA